MTETIRSLREHLPASEDLLRAIGLQQERSAMSALTTVTAFAVGALAGAVLAVLFAPKAGSELREELGDRAREFGDRMGWTEHPDHESESQPH